MNRLLCVVCDAKNSLSTSVPLFRNRKTRNRRDGWWRRRSAIIHSAEVNVACRKEDFRIGIDALPRNKQHMTTDSLRELQRHVIVRPTGPTVTRIAAFIARPRQCRRLCARNLHQIRPSQRKIWVVSISRHIRLEKTWVMRSCRIETTSPRTRHHHCCRPIRSRKIQSCILLSASARNLSIRNRRLIVVIQYVATDFVPIIKRLRSSHGNRGKNSVALRTLWVFQKALICSTDRIGHRAVSKCSCCGKKKTSG